MTEAAASKELHLKYADLLGKPLSKSVYRQLPKWNAAYVEATDDGFLLKRDVMIHGCINWCAPDCREYMKHQHVLVGAQGGYWQGVIFLGTDASNIPAPWLKTLYAKYDAAEQEHNNLQVSLNALQNPQGSRLFGESVAEWEKYDAEKDRHTKRLKELEQCLNQLCRHLHKQHTAFLASVLETKPIILLRG